MTMHRKRSESEALLFLDIETTGTDPQRCSIIDVALVAESGRVLFAERFRPTYGALVSEGAMRANGYDPRTWDGTRSMCEVDFSILRGRIGNNPIVGKNAFFDLEFLKRQAAAVDCDLRWPYRAIDLTTLGFVAFGRLLSSDDLSKVLGLPPETKPHGALAGAQWARAVYLELEKRLEVRDRGLPMARAGADEEESE